MSTRSMPTTHGRPGHARRGLTALLALCLLLPASVLAATVRTGDVVKVGPQEVIDDDLYAFADTVDIQGTVRGDVVTATRSLTLSGTVEGDVMAAASELRVSGPIRGSLRGAGNSLDVSGPVGKDVLLAGNTVSLGRSATIAGDLFLAGNKAEVASPVAGQLHAASQTLTLSSTVGGDMRAEVGALHLVQGAHVGGDLRYRGQQGAVIDPGASVAGSLERLPAEHREAGPLFYAYAWLRSVVGLFLLGLALVLLSPRLARGTTATLKQQPWRSLGWGAVLFFGVPLIAAGVLIVGALVGGWWLGLFVLALYALALALAFPVVGLLIGQWLLARFGKAGPSMVVALLVGIVLLMAVRWVPILGGLVAMATLLFGLGALVLALAGVRRQVEAPA